MGRENYLERELYELIRSDVALFDFLQIAALDGLWYWDVERPEHEWMSPRFWEVLGYDPAAKKHLASEWQHLTHPDDLRLALENFEKHCADPSHPYDQVVRYRHADGSTVWVRCRGRAIRGPDGTARRLLGAHTDITAVKRAEEELRRANRRLEEQSRQLLEARRRVEERTRELEEAQVKYKDLFDNSPDMLGVVAADDATLLECNRALAAKLGYDRSEIIGRPVFDLYHPSCIEDAKRTFQCFRETGVVNDVELEMMRKDGRIVAVVLNASDVRDKSGRLVYQRSVWQDITERKRAALAVARRNEDLETLLNVVSHDLREPLRAIKTFSRMVRDRYAEQLDDKGHDFLERVTRAGRRLDVLIEDILELSRAKHERFATRWVAGEVVVERALSQLDDAIAATEARIRLEQDFPRLHVDPTWAVQAVVNLLSNALKFRADTRPDLEIGAYRPEPGERTGVGIVVRDRGPGIEPGHAERIFELFQRNVGREIEGTGAGLAIVRQVAQRHGGTAWVNPRSGGGSEFIVTFGDPARESNRTPAQDDILHVET